MHGAALIATQVRLIGLVFVLWSLPGVGDFIDGVVEYFRWYGWHFGDALGSVPVHLFDGEYGLFGPGARVLQFVFGLYLLLRGGAVINRLTRSLSGRCPKCGYNTKGLRAVQCPECGAALPAAPKPEAGGPQGRDRPSPEAPR